MLVQETQIIQREIHVAPCLECGNTDIQLSDSNYSSFNRGVGKCKKCGHEVNAGVGCNPSMDQLAGIWNAANDIQTLIKAEEDKIVASRKRIVELKEKHGPVLTLLDEDEKSECLMTAEDFLREDDLGMLTSDDGSGVWATQTHKSDVSTSVDKPEWATHVVWYNK